MCNSTESPCSGGEGRQACLPLQLRHAITGVPAVRLYIRYMEFGIRYSYQIYCEKTPYDLSPPYSSRLRSGIAFERRMTRRCLLFQLPTNVLYGKGLAPSVNHCMTVRTYGTQVLDRVNDVALADLGYGNQMVYVYILCAESPVALLEHEISDRAGWPVVANASPSGGAIAFVRVHSHLTDRAFGVVPISNLVRARKEVSIGWRHWKTTKGLLRACCR